MTADIEHIRKELTEIVGDELRSVSYKWLARRHGIPVNLAKQILFSFADECRSKVQATYLLAGWTTEGDKRHVFQLVDAKQLQEFKQKLDPVTSIHVYAVQPAHPKDPAALWNADHQQLTELYDRMLKEMQANCLAENTISAVFCPEAKRNPELLKKRKLPATPAAIDAALPKKSGAFAARIDGVMAGATGAKGGVASATVATEVEGLGKQAASSAPNSAPAVLAEEKQAAGPPKQKPQKGDKLQKMWNKAPAKKEKPPKKEKLPKQKARDTAAEEDDAIAQEREPSSEEEEDDFRPAAKRRSGRKSTFQINESDSSEEEGDKPGKGRMASTAKKAKALRADGRKKEEAMAGSAPGHCCCPVEKAPPSAAWFQRLTSWDNSKGKSAGKRGRSADVQQRFAGQVKVGGPSGAKRRKVARSVINDKGEEVTEEVWESDEDSPGLDEPPPPPEAASGRAKETSSPPEAKKGALAKKQSPPKGTRKPVKGKGPGAGQKSLTSFFQKK